MIIIENAKIPRLQKVIKTQINNLILSSKFGSLSVIFLTNI